MKKRILLFSEELGPGGGGRGVSAFALQTLAREYDLTLLCWAPPDRAATDEWCDTDLKSCDWRYAGPAAADRLLVGALRDATRFQRVNVLQKRARHMAADFDAVVACCSMEVDLGVPVVQYLHYPYLGHLNWRAMTPGSAPLPVVAGALLRGRIAPWMAVSGYSFERMRRNLTLTNSHWTVRRIGELFEMPARVLYPPAAGRFPDTPWAQRRDGFVAIGRMEPSKRFGWMIETLRRLRARGRQVELHICTHLDEVLHEPEELERVRALAREAGDWVHLHYNLPRADLMALLGANRYGLHAKIDEHFGMAPAEMARAGCLPFVHESGGQVEIVDSDPRLTFRTEDDAVEKMVALLRDDGAQQAMLARVGQRARMFAPEEFARGLVGNVEQFMARGWPEAIKEGLV